MTRRLRIGISACFFHSDPKRPIFKGKTLLYIEESLAHWVSSLGAFAVMIPSGTSGAADELDALVLHGGADVSPRSYGEEPLKPEWSGDFVRDQYEIALLREFADRKKPVLGVCRGAQLVNVAYGGTLVQDIELQVPGALTHRNWEIYDRNFHDLAIEPGSGLHRLYGIERARVNTVHHQAVKDLGSGLRVEAYSPADRIPEAIRLQADHYVFAVQWHPEYHDRSDPSLLPGEPLLREFLDEARKKCSKS